MLDSRILQFLLSTLLFDSDNLHLGIRKKRENSAIVMIGAAQQFFVGKIPPLSLQLMLFVFRMSMFIHFYWAKLL